MSTVFQLIEVKLQHIEDFFLLVLSHCKPMEKTFRTLNMSKQNSCPISFLCFSIISLEDEHMKNKNKRPPCMCKSIVGSFLKTEITWSSKNIDIDIDIDTITWRRQLSLKYRQSKQVNLKRVPQHAPTLLIFLHIERKQGYVGMNEKVDVTFWCNVANSISPNITDAHKK